MDITLLTEREVADFIGKSTKTMQRWRAQGRGPVAMRFGQSVMYTRESVSNWMQAQRIRPGGEPA